MNTNHCYCIIMAGGEGRRLWPESRKYRPKQFIDFFGTGRTLLQQTFDRFADWLPDARSRRRDAPHPFDSNVLRIAMAGPRSRHQIHLLPTPAERRARRAQRGNRTRRLSQLQPLETFWIGNKQISLSLLTGFPPEGPYAES